VLEQQSKLNHESEEERRLKELTAELNDIKAETDE
jgi:uncharacterized phage infection (PIP) family protein YhgE